MDFEKAFANQLGALCAEGDYRSFATMERRCGAFPHAFEHSENRKREVTAWCSNDCLGIGQHPDAVQAMCDTAKASGAAPRCAALPDGFRAGTRLP